MEEPRISMDFQNDVGLMAKSRLEEVGYTVDDAASPETQLHRYLNAAFRRIPNNARRVHVARECDCPDNLRPAFEMICRKAQSGESLVPFQSRQLAGLDFNDSLLNDWGIHHLHLSSTPDPTYPKRMTGTKELLFAFVTATDFYCIDVLTHGDWAEKDLLDIMDRNWKGLVPRINGVVPEQLSSENILKLRGAGINAIVAAEDGTGYAPLGGGYSMSGLSSRVVIMTDHIMVQLGRVEQDARNGLLRWLATGGAKEEQIRSHYNLRLMEENGQLFAHDAEAHVTVALRGIYPLESLEPF